MIETCIIKIAGLYGTTIAISFIILLTLCLVIRFNKRIQKSVTDKYGLDVFCKSDHFTQEIWFLIFVALPVVAVGKIEDIFCHRGIDMVDHTKNNLYILFHHLRDFHLHHKRTLDNLIF